MRRPPLLRQLAGDPYALGRAVQSQRSEQLRPRTATADRIVKSVCPFCAVGCGQSIYVKDEQVVHDRGRPGQPDLPRTAVPEGLLDASLVTSPTRETKVKYRRPYGTEWEDLDLDRALDMIADRVIETRARTWQDARRGRQHAQPNPWLRSLGGATLDNEENYLIKKFFTAAGAVAVENQARI